MKEWTVIGFYYGGRIVVAGVVEGSHRVAGGDVSLVSDEGCWAATVSAPAAEEAGDLVAGTGPEEDEAGEADAAEIMHDTVREQTGENA